MTLKDLGMPSPYEEIKELREKLKSVMWDNKKMKDALEIYAMTNKTFPEYGDLARETLKKLGEK